MEEKEVTARSRIMAKVKESAKVKSRESGKKHKEKKEQEGGKG